MGKGVITSPDTCRFSQHVDMNGILRLILSEGNTVILLGFGASHYLLIIKDNLGDTSLKRSAR